MRKKNMHSNRPRQPHLIDIRSAGKFTRIVRHDAATIRRCSAKLTHIMRRCAAETSWWTTRFESLLPFPFCPQTIHQIFSALFRRQGDSEGLARLSPLSQQGLTCQQVPQTGSQGPCSSCALQERSAWMRCGCGSYPSTPVRHAARMTPCKPCQSFKAAYFLANYYDFCLQSEPDICLPAWRRVQLLWLTHLQCVMNDLICEPGRQGQNLNQLQKVFAEIGTKGSLHWRNMGLDGTNLVCPAAGDFWETLRPSAQKTFCTPTRQLWVICAKEKAEKRENEKKAAEGEGERESK